MQFHIEKLVLWPDDKKHAPQIMELQSGKINIIHGRSGTGKSSITAIIDYCLGASRCAIPVGIIRDKVKWFGLVIRVREAAFLVARHTPGSRQVSKEFFLGAFNDTIPQELTATHNDNQYKEAFNNLVRLTNLPLAEGETIGQYEGRPSYRDLAAFNFLPQHIVANPNTLFYKADSYDHKEKLKKVFPIALDIINTEYLLKERERIILQRQFDELLKQKEIKRRSMMAWDAEVEDIWNQSVELGLVKDEQAATTDKRMEILGHIHAAFLNGGLSELLEAPNYLATNRKFREAQNDEERLQKEVDSLRREVRGYERLAERAAKFTNAVQLEKSRVINLDWLKQRLGDEHECVVCGSNTNQIHSVVSRLEFEVDRVSGLSNALFESPIVDKEIESTKSSLFKLQNDLHEARSKRISLQQVDAGPKDSVGKVYLLMGLIQALLRAYATINDEDSMSHRLSLLEIELKKLDVYFLNSGRAARELSVDKEIGELIERYAKEFNLEQRGTIRLDKQELTLSFQKLDDFKKEYLWEVGSGANWMGYHIATFLALHEYFSKFDMRNSPVFSFIVIDQPSQVYFPSAASGINQLDVDANAMEKLKHERDVDIRATKKIFEMLEYGLKAAGYKYQVIVLEHADNSIWGDLPNTLEVANWKRPDAGLIPAFW